MLLLARDRVAVLIGCRWLYSNLATVASRSDTTAGASLCLACFIVSITNATLPSHDSLTNCWKHNAVV